MLLFDVYNSVVIFLPGLFGETTVWNIDSNRLDNRGLCLRLIGLSYGAKSTEGTHVQEHGALPKLKEGKTVVSPLDLHQGE